MMDVVQPESRVQQQGTGEISQQQAAPESVNPQAHMGDNYLLTVANQRVAGSCST